MRVDLKKFLFIGMNKDRKVFFEEAQKIGLVHFIDINPKKLKEVPSEINNIAAAMKVLRTLPTAEQEETDEYSLADGIAFKILQIRDHLEKLAEDERVLKLELARVEPYGDFSFEDIKVIEQQGNRVVQFFISKSGIFEDQELPEGLIFLTSEHGIDYYVAINKTAVQYEKLSEIHIPHPFGEVKKMLHRVRKEMHETDHRLKSYAKYNVFLHHAFIKKLNNYHLKANEEYVQLALDQDIFAVEGWVPEDEIATIQALSDQVGVHMEEVAIEETDRIPTYLKNKGLERIGEDLVHIYDTPSHTDKDPSMWVLFFFAFFFAMIVGDAGYGLVFLATALWIRYRHKKMKSLARRIWILAVILCSFIIIWGTLTNSVFGITISPENAIRKISIINWLVQKKVDYVFTQHGEDYKAWVKEIPKLKDAKTSQEFLQNAIEIKHGVPENEMYHRYSDQILMELALMVGIIHIILSFARYLDRNWEGIGWIIFIIGCYLYVPYFLNIHSMIHFAFGIDKVIGGMDGLYLIIGGLAIAVFLAIVKHKFLGILEVMTVIQIFADTMSYLRLYALALAGALVALTINEFASALPFVLGAVLFTIGHLTNMALGIMGGIIHGLRLNFLEWYHYSFEGGGKRFNPLRLLQIE